MRISGGQRLTPWTIAERSAEEAHLDTDDKSYRMLFVVQDGLHLRGNEVRCGRFLRWWSSTASKSAWKNAAKNFGLSSSRSNCSKRPEAIAGNPPSWKAAPTIRGVQRHAGKGGAVPELRPVPSWMFELNDPRRLMGRTKGGMNMKSHAATDTIVLHGRWSGQRLHWSQRARE